MSKNIRWKNPEFLPSSRTPQRLDFLTATTPRRRNILGFDQNWGNMDLPDIAGRQIQRAETRERRRNRPLQIQTQDGLTRLFHQQPRGGGTVALNDQSVRHFGDVPPTYSAPSHYLDDISKPTTFKSSGGMNKTEQQLAMRLKKDLKKKREEQELWKRFHKDNLDRILQKEINNPRRKGLAQRKERRKKTSGHQEPSSQDGLTRLFHQQPRGGGTVALNDQSVRHFGDVPPTYSAPSHYLDDISKPTTLKRTPKIPKKKTLSQQLKQSVSLRPSGGMNKTEQQRLQGIKKDLKKEREEQELWKRFHKANLDQILQKEINDEVRRAEAQGDIVRFKPPTERMRKLFGSRVKGEYQVFDKTTGRKKKTLHWNKQTKKWES